MIIMGQWEQVPGELFLRGALLYRRDQVNCELYQGTSILVYHDDLAKDTGEDIFDNNYFVLICNKGIDLNKCHCNSAIRAQMIGDYLIEEILQGNGETIRFVSDQLSNFK